MSVQAVIPTIPGREDLLAVTVASFDDLDIDSIVVRESPSCGAGWKIGLDRADADYVLLASDDLEALHGWPGLAVALSRMADGFLVCPPLYWPDGTLQGSGGWELTLADGEQAGNCCFPFGRREGLLALWPWPETNHYCDSWITELADSRGLGPIVTSGIPLMHKVATTPADGELQVYLEWRLTQLGRLAAA